MKRRRVAPPVPARPAAGAYRPVPAVPAKQPQRAVRVPVATGAPEARRSKFRAEASAQKARRVPPPAAAVEAARVKAETEAAAKRRDELLAEARALEAQVAAQQAALHAAAERERQAVLVAKYSAPKDFQHPPASTVHRMSVASALTMASTMSPIGASVQFPIREYVSSDDEGYASDDTQGVRSDDESAPAIPDWARKEKLARHMHKQAAMDPDAIFGAVSRTAFDLGDVFDTASDARKAEFNKRTSSVWTRR